MTAGDDRLAAELALGVLDGAERVRALAREQAEPAFAAAVAAWRARLAPLAEEVAPEEPSAALWGRIDAALGPRLAFAAESAPARPRRWSWAALGAVAASLLWVAALIGLQWRPPPPPSATPRPAAAMMMASLAPAAGARPYWVALVEPAAGEVRIMPAAASPADARARELWLLPAGGKPMPLGVFAESGGAMAMPRGAMARARAGSRLAVSLEPPGGSPTGAPTGPVIAAGALTTA